MTGGDTSQGDTSTGNGLPPALVPVVVAVEGLLGIILILQLTGVAAGANTTTVTLLVVIVLVALVPFASSITFPGGGGITLRDTTKVVDLVRQVTSAAATPKPQAAAAPPSPPPVRRVDARGTIRARIMSIPVADLAVGKEVTLPPTPGTPRLFIARHSDSELNVETEPESPPPPWRELFRSSPILGVGALRSDIESHLRKLAQIRSVPAGTAAIGLRPLVRALGTAGVLSGPEQDAILSVTDLCNQAVHGRRMDPTVAEQMSAMGEDLVVMLEARATIPT